MAKKNVSIAKITRPVLAGSYPRKRLFGLIDRARKRQVLWISGPPGSGKTTLVSSYIAARRLPGMWFRLEEEDADPATFFHYLGLAAKKAAPRFRKFLPVPTPEQLSAVTPFARRYFDILFSRLHAGSVIVFDDYQNIPADSAIPGMIHDSLSLLPPGIKVFLVSREQPSPLFARLYANRSLGLIGWKDLRLSPQEMEGIARQRWKGKGARETIRSLHAISDGWAAGFVLLLEKAGPGSGTSLGATRYKPQEILDYFAGEILETLDEETYSFLLKSALLPRMTVVMAAKLTGLRGAGQMLSTMNRRNYFTEVRPGPEPVYEFHPLFREFLRSRTAEFFSEKYVRRLQAKAAAILEESGYIEEAAGILCETGDWRGLAQIVRGQAPLLVRQGRSATLAEWLETFPADVREDDPWLLYWRGVAGLSSRPGESRRDFEEAFRRFTRQKDREGILLAWAGVVEAILYGPGSLKSLDPWFATLGRLRKNKKPPVSEEVESQVTSAMIKALALRRPPFIDMEEWADRALRLSRETRDVSRKFTSLLNVAYYRFHSGDSMETGLLLETLRNLVRRPEVSPLSRLILCWLEAAHANVNGLHDRALAIVSEGFELADATGIHHMDLLIAGHGALSSLHRGDMAAAAGFMRRMASLLSTARPWEASFYHYLAAWEMMHRGEKAQALLQSDHCLALCAEVGNPWTEALARLQRAFVLHRGGDENEATRHLRRARRMGKESGMQFVCFACLLAEGYFSLLRGDEASALPSLRKGLRMGKEKGYFDIYLWHPGLLETVSSKAIEKGIETEYVLDLIRRNALVPDGALAESGHWPWPLKLHTLGTFEILKGEKPLTFSRKVQHKPLLMLKVLVALGGRDVPEEQMTDILWPDAEGDLAHQSFATTLRRLRNLLGDEKAVSLREGRLTLDSRHCWVDLFAFVSLLSRIDAEGQRPETDVADARTAHFAEKAISLYRGPFLPGEASHPWAVGVRERMRSKFLRAVGFMGSFLEKEGRWPEAVACYRRGLEVDDLEEEFYQRLMICHHLAGQTAQALAVYNRCRKVLAAVLGVAPSADTESAAAKIRSA